MRDVRGRVCSLAAPPPPRDEASTCALVLSIVCTDRLGHMCDRMSVAVSIETVPLLQRNNNYRCCLSQDTRRY